jgi:hypothetical protein
MTKILDLAKNNSSNIDHKYNSLSLASKVAFCQFLKSEKEFSITSFRGFVKGEKVDWKKFQMQPSISTILQTGVYKSQWEVDEKAAPNHFGKFARQRIAFDNTFEHGKKFKYLALTAGTMGLPFWGDVTLVFDPAKFSDDEYVGLKHNSLARNANGNGHYYFSGTKVDLNKLGVDLSPANDLEKLAAIKLEGEIDTKGPEKYKYLLIKALHEAHKDYVEIITWKEIKLSDCLTAIRAKRADYKIIAKAIYEMQSGKKPNTASQSIVNMIEFHKLIADYATQGVKLDLVDE